MLRRLVILTMCAGFMSACGSDDTEEPLVIVSGNNATNNATNNASNNATNNTTNNQTSNNATNNGLQPFDRPDLVTLADEDIVTADNGVSQEISFTVPENTQSVVVTIVGASPGSYTVRSWTNGDGTPLVNLGWLATDQGAPSLCLGCPQRVTSAESAMAGMVPTNPDVSVKPGTHAVTFYSYRQTSLVGNRTPLAGPARVIVTAKVAPAVPESGVLDLNLWFSGAQGLTAETAPTDVNFQQMLKDVGIVYGKVGLKLGRITYNDIEGDFDIIENAIVPGNAMKDLFAQSANAPQDAVNVFFVEDLLTGRAGQQGFGILLGVSGGIPGPVGLMGTERSGVVLALKRSPMAPTPLFKVMAHEVGHFLGLYHTTEQNAFGGPAVNDQLADTPENDATYLMHNTGNGEILSPSQGTTMRLNPWVRQEAN
ncbi:MAG: M43 family zinc metalloprotease [bacterium]